MNKQIKATIIGLALLGTALSAETSPYEYSAKSLVGIEGGYSGLDYNKDSQSIQSVKLANVGLKIGAESKDFRFFLSGRYFYDSTTKYEYLKTFLLISYIKGDKKSRKKIF